MPHATITTWSHPSTVARDEDRCVVLGMPREASKRGGVERTVPLQAIAAEFMKQQ